VGKTGNTPQNDTTAQQSDAQNHTRIGWTIRAPPPVQHSSSSASAPQDLTNAEKRRQKRRRKKARKKNRSSSRLTPHTSAARRSPPPPLATSPSAAARAKPQAQRAAPPDPLDPTPGAAPPQAGRPRPPPPPPRGQIRQRRSRIRRADREGAAARPARHWLGSIQRRPFCRCVSWSCPGPQVVSLWRDLGNVSREVLFFGGLSVNFISFKRCELFDPASGHNSGIREFEF
jgi:hypothetical protein